MPGLSEKSVLRSCIEDERIRHARPIFTNLAIDLINLTKNSIQQLCVLCLFLTAKVNMDEN